MLSVENLYSMTRSVFSPQINYILRVPASLEGRHQII